MKDRKVKQVLSRVWHPWEGGEFKERVTTVEILCSHAWKWKNETVPGMGGGGIKEKDGGGEFYCDIL
jgi:hypothetical protein